MKYTVDYFINKFKKIPENKWCTITYDNGNGQYCALGHCGANYNSDFDCDFSEEASELQNLFFNELKLDVATVNDSTKMKEKTPKKRILAMLKKIKRKQK